MKIETPEPTPSREPHTLARSVRRFLAIAICLGSPQLLANTHYETVTFVGNDGMQFVNYTTTRSEAPTYTVHLEKSESLEDYLYINPNDYTFDNTHADKNRLTFAQGDYALVSQGSFDQSAPKQVEIDEDGIYTLKTWNGRTLANKHFGYWNDPEPFTNFAAVWVFPDHFEVNDYLSNKPGEWIKRRNTLTFLTTEKNDITFKISYSPKTQRIYAALKRELHDSEAIEISQSAESVKLTIRNEILFDSGQVEVNSQGLAVITDLATQLGETQELAVVVAGHTDDVPIIGALAQRYPTNWELSAHRSLNVVHALIAAGISPEWLQSHAFGSQQPKQPNTNAVSRGINRRTEIIISPR